MVSRNLIYIGSALIVIGLVFFFGAPVIPEQSSSLGAPAPSFEDEDITEMIVEEEPVTMFCRIYPGSVRCN